MGAPRIWQLTDYESNTFTYLLADMDAREAIIIDPVRETLERDLQVISDHKLSLKFVLETHVHADHITSAAALRRATGAKVAYSAESGVEGADLLLQDGDSLEFGSFQVKALLTPGHTDGCTSYLVANFVFTGDALLIRGCGRTDFQQGSAEKLFASVREKLFRLSDDTVVYPGHEYRGRPYTTIGEEKELNPRLNLKINLDEFKQIMSELNLDPPQKLAESVPANLKCGEVLR